MDAWMKAQLGAFTTTECGCRDCVDCCKRQPGPLNPGDYERIAAHLQWSHEQMRAHFVASPGALVMDTATRHQFRIGSITPKYDKRAKRCVFLDADDRCRIHAVAPAGCRYFDTHMTRAEGAARAAWMARQQTSPDYQALRSTLPFTDYHKDVVV